MNEDKSNQNNSNEDNSSNQEQGDNKGQHLINPLTGKESNITQEDIDNEQKLKEAMTERD